MRIDWWTLGFQTVNVVILVWLLGRFFWRPVAGMIAQRRAAAEQTLAEAAAKRQEADAAMAEIERIRAGFDAERAAILSAAQAAATRLQDAKLAETRRQMETLAAQEVARREKERDDTNKEWAARASRLAVDMAGRLAARLDGQVVQAAFLGWLITEIRALPAHFGRHLRGTRSPSTTDTRRGRSLPTGLVSWTGAAGDGSTTVMLRTVMLRSAGPRPGPRRAPPAAAQSGLRCFRGKFRLVGAEKEA